jgi:hypothetical protein
MDEFITFLMKNAKVTLPALVLLLKIVVKLFAGRRAEGKNFLELLYELPTDIIFLALSFSFAYFFLDQVTKKETMIVSLFIVIISVCVVVIFRECKILDDAKRTWQKVTLLIVFLIINYGVSVFTLLYTSDNLVSINSKANNEKNIEIKNTKECK